MAGLAPETEKKIKLYLGQCSVPCRAINYLKIVWKEYLILKYEVENLRKQQRINRP